MIVVKSALLGIGRRARVDARRVPARRGRGARGSGRGASQARDELPRVAAVVAAHNEETVIERRLENLVGQDYPADRLEIVVASDASTDRTDELVDEIAAREPRIRLLRCERGGKVAAQNRAVRETDAEILAFTDAATEWAPTLCASSSAPSPIPTSPTSPADTSTAPPTARTARGRTGSTSTGSARASLGSARSRAGSARSTRCGARTTSTSTRASATTSRFPYLMVQHGKRAVYDPEALAYEKPSRDLEDEYKRKVRMLEHCWLITLKGGMLRRLGPVYAVEIVSHRHLRYASGVLHLIALGTNIALVPRGRRLPGHARRPARAARPLRRRARGSPATTCW